MDYTGDLNDAPLGALMGNPDGDTTADQVVNSYYLAGSVVDGDFASVAEFGTEITEEEGKSSALVTDLGSSYQENCGGYPVLFWQEATEHQYGEAVEVEAGCLLGSHKESTCGVCGDVKITDVKDDATGNHDYEDGTCVNCGATIKVEASLDPAAVDLDGSAKVVTLNLRLESEADLAGSEFTLELPEGITVAENGISALGMTNIRYDAESGKVLCYVADGQNAEDIETLAVVKLRVDPTVTADDYEIKVTDLLLAAYKADNLSKDILRTDELTTALKVTVSAAPTTYQVEKSPEQAEADASEATGGVDYVGHIANPVADHQYTILYTVGDTEKEVDADNGAFTIPGKEITADLSIVIVDNTEVATVINLIGVIGEVTKDSGDAITAARSAYDQLNDAEKERVTNYDDLTAAEEAFANLSQGGSSGGGTVAKEYTVTLPTDLVNGEVKADKTKAAKGETVIITVTPNGGYEPEQVSVTDQKDHSVELKDLGNDKYSFIMPASAVTISVTFKAALEEDCPSARFADVKRDGWYHAAIDYVVEEGMMNGVSDTLFAPNDATTRAMIATILWRLEGSPEANADMDYQDVAADSWYEEAVCWATQAGVVEGYGNGTFLPNGDITREEMAAMLYRYAEYKGVDTEAIGDADLDRFDDAAVISSWAVDAMNWACGTGLMQGTPENNLEPDSGATRAEAAQMLKNYSLEISA